MGVRPGYKQTEVGVIPEDWEVAPIAELVIVGPKNGYSGRSGKEARGTPTLSLGATTLGSMVLNEETVKRLDETIPTNSDLYLKPGDVLVQRSNTIDLVGTTAIFDGFAGVYVYPDLMMRMRFRDDATSHWFWRYANSANGRRFFVSVAAGSSGSMPKISGEKLRKMQLPLPPLPEQRAIAETLSDVDGLLAALDRLIAKKRDLKQAAMQQLLTGQTRLPGFQDDWEVVPLGKLAKIQRGASPRPIDSPVWFDDNSVIGWVRISDVTRSGMYLLETTQRLSPLGVKQSRPVARGSLIMSICATVGRPIIAEIDICIHDGFVVFENLQADQMFLYYVLKWIEPEWSKQGQTGSQMNLNVGLITGTPVSLPSLPEQTAIAEVLSYMDAELAALEQRRDKTRLLKQAMMQELLTGRTRLVPPGGRE